MKAIFSLVLFISIYGCRDPKVSELVREMQGPKYIQTIQTENLVVQVRYLPTIMQVLSHAKLDTLARLSSAVLAGLKPEGNPNPGLVFLLKLSPADTTSVRGLEKDVIYGKINGYGGIKEAQEAFQFKLKDKIWIESGGLKYQVSSFIMENSWGLSNSRTFFLVFPWPREKKSTEQIRFQLVMDAIIPGLDRKNLTWTLPLGKYDELI